MGKSTYMAASIIRARKGRGAGWHQDSAKVAEATWISIGLQKQARAPEITVHYHQRLRICGEATGENDRVDRVPSLFRVATRGFITGSQRLAFWVIDVIASMLRSTCVRQTDYQALALVGIQQTPGALSCSNSSSPGARKGAET